MGGKENTTLCRKCNCRGNTDAGGTEEGQVNMNRIIVGCEGKLSRGAENAAELGRP